MVKSLQPKTPKNNDITVEIQYNSGQFREYCIVLNNKNGVILRTIYQSYKPTKAEIDAYVNFEFITD